MISHIKPQSKSLRYIKLAAKHCLKSLLLLLYVKKVSRTCTVLVLWDDINTKLHILWFFPPSFFNPFCRMLLYRHCYLQFLFKMGSSRYNYVMINGKMSVMALSMPEIHCSLLFFIWPKLVAYRWKTGRETASPGPPHWTERSKTCRAPGRRNTHWRDWNIFIRKRSSWRHRKLIKGFYVIMMNVKMFRYHNQ